MMLLAEGCCKFRFPLFNYSTVVIPEFAGTFYGNGFTIGNLTIVGGAHLGLIGTIQYAGEVKNLGVVDANVVGTWYNIGALVAVNNGIVTESYCTGSVSGEGNVGGLVGAFNEGTINNSFRHQLAQQQNGVSRNGPNCPCPTAKD